MTPKPQDIPCIALQSIANFQCIAITLSILTIAGTNLATRRTSTDQRNTSSRKTDNIPIHTSLNAPERYFAHNHDILHLCHAINNGESAEVSRKLESGLDLNATGECGMTVLLWTLVTMQTNYADALLLHGANPNLPLSCHVTYSSYFLEEGDTYLTATLKHRLTSQFTSALPYSSRPAKTDRYGSTILHLYIASAILDSWSDPHPIHLSDIEQILATGVDINQPGRRGSTALHYAAESKPNYIPFLINKGADPHLGNWNSETPVQYVIRSAHSKFQEERNKYAEAVRWMTRRGLINKSDLPGN